MEANTVATTAQRKLHAEHSSTRQTARIRPWQAEPLSDVLLELDSSLEGLSELEAARRLAETGPNELNAKPPRTLAQMAREQLTDPMILILLVAAVLSALLQEWAEAGIIFAIVMVNAVIGIVQERKAQSSLEALRSMSAPEARSMEASLQSRPPCSDWKARQMSPPLVMVACFLVMVAPGI